MSTIEVTGKNVADATAKAATELGVDAKSITVTVLDEQKGLFGKSTVKIRAEVAAAKPKKGAKAKAVEVEVVEPAAEAVIEEPVAEVVAAPAKPKRGAKKAEPAKAVVQTAEPAEGEEEAEERAEVVATEEDEAAIASIVAELMASGDLDVQVEETSRQGKYVNVVLDGKDAAHLVGKHGEVLNALQYLVNVMLTQKRKNGVRATIDGGNYRRKREEALTKLATNIANEVKKRGEEAVLDALPAFERRIVHKALSVIEGISTYSEGEEPNRRVVIAPSE